MLSLVMLADPVVFELRVIDDDAESIRGVAVGDVNGDGRPDIVAAIAADRTVAWFENRPGEPVAFVRHDIDTTRRHPNFPIVIDFDADGDQDIVCSGAVDDGIVWYENNGMPESGFERHVIDIDPDGIVDNGNEGFADGVRQIAVADFDGDGDSDVAAVSVKNDRVSWFRNTGDGFEPISLADDLIGARAIVAADMDSDGDPDIVAGAWQGDDILWFENDGAGEFTRRVLADGFVPNANAWSFKAADVDADGDMDVVATRGVDHEASWFENDGLTPPSFGYNIITRSALTAKSAVPADVDGDGDLDVLVASWSDDKVAWHESDGAADPSFEERIIRQDPDGPNIGVEGEADGARTIAAADFDLDGDLDIVWASRLNATLAWERSSFADCAIDLTGDGEIDYFDLQFFLEAFFAGRSIADWNTDGVFDFTDVQSFLTDFGGLCG